MAARSQRVGADQAEQFGDDPVHAVHFADDDVAVFLPFPGIGEPCRNWTKPRMEVSGVRSSWAMPGGHFADRGEPVGPRHLLLERAGLADVADDGQHAGGMAPPVQELAAAGHTWGSGAPAAKSNSTPRWARPLRSVEQQPGEVRAPWNSRRQGLPATSAGPGTGTARSRRD